MAGFLGRAGVLLGRALVSFGLGAKGGGAPAVVPRPGCMHVAVEPTASMEIALEPTASMEIALEPTAAMTIRIEAC